MLFNVPQFTDIEDKVVGPFTAKQMGWLALGGIIIFISWSILDVQAFFVAAIIIGLFFGALAFYRPYNQPFIQFLFSGISFFFRPKMYVWRRVYDTMASAKRTIVPKAVEKKIAKKKLDYRKIEDLTKILDTK